MDWSVRAMRLTTAIKKAAPGLGCDVRVTQKKVARPGQLSFDLFVVVVTVTIWGHGPNNQVREVTFEERHFAHEQIAVEFWQDIAENALLSIQLVG